MASRRTRIKGIANIPQRKKTVVGTVETDKKADDNKEFVILNESLQTLAENNSKTNSEKLTPLSRTESNFVSQEITVLTNNSFVADKEVKVSKEDIQPRTNLNYKDVCRKPNIEKSLEKVKQAQVLKHSKEDNILTSHEIANDTSKPQPNVGRRKFLKPVINLNSANKRNFNNKDSCTTQLYDELEERAITTSNKISNLNKIESKEACTSIEKIIEAGKVVNNKVPKIQETSQIKPIYPQFPTNDVHNTVDRHSAKESEITLTETHLFPNNTGSSNVPISYLQGVKKIVPETQNLTLSDSEYPVPPASPSKINRSRIKAIPRLSQRKTSFSASESEDETRKYGRIRNNSVCSIASTVPEPPTPTTESVPPKDIMPVLQKKIIRTEQSRRLAEARKEFQKRFGSSNPDKQRLKMIDLIFYNPITNPMSLSHKKSPDDLEETETTVKETDTAKETETVKETDTVKEKETADSVNDVANESDSENNMLVPQIKIGPSGEIILDEKSLIVENAEVTKLKEKMQQSQVVDGDFDTGYGIYKKAPRSKEWPQIETLRFYKALNLIGTDFSIMTKLFPKRTRRELKMKFKKEERINRHLIDKAIKQPCSYNLSEFKREVEFEEKEQAALQKLKEDEKEKRLSNWKAKCERKRKAKKSKEQENENKSKPPKRLKQKPLNIASVLDDSDADVSDIETQSDESEKDEEIVPPMLQPTRSGRMPKSTQRYNYKPEKSFMDEMAGNIKRQRSSSLDSNPEKLVPGSVVIMTEEGPDKKCKYKIFMVTPDKKLTPLELEPEVLSKLIKEKLSADAAQNIALHPEENVTIPASKDAALVKEKSENEVSSENEDMEAEYIKSETQL